MTKGDEGYTLLELIIAVAIMALMAVPLAQGIELGLKRWGRQQVQISDFERVMMVRHRLGQWISAAYPFDIYRNDALGLLPLIGNSNQMAFVSAVGPDPRADILYRVILLLDDSKLEARIVPDHMSYFDNYPIEEVVLIEGVSSVELAYLDTEADSVNLLWTDSWSRTVFPAAVRMRVQFEDERRLWPDLIIPLVVRERSFCLPEGTECAAGAYIL